MSVTEWDIVHALCEALAELTGLHAYEAPEPSLQTPACFPLLDQDFNVDWQGGSGYIDGELMLITQWVAGLARAGARTLADYAADTGDKSINAKLHASSLGGVVKSVQVRGVSRGEIISMPDGRVYYGRPIRIRIYP